MPKSVPSLICYLLLQIFVVSLLSGCGDDNDNDLDQEGNVDALPELPNIEQLEGEISLQGVIADGGALAFASVCSLADNFCTQADLDGQFRLVNLQQQNGLLLGQAAGVDAVPLVSLYQHQQGELQYRANINPSTDVLTRMAFINSCGHYELTADSMASCDLAAINRSISDLEEGLAWLLGPLWPANRSAFSSPYVAQPSLDRFDYLHAISHYRLEGDQFYLEDRNGQLLTQASIKELIQLPNTAGLPHLAALTDEDLLSFGLPEDSGLPGASPIMAAFSQELTPVPARFQTLPWRTEASVSTTRLSPALNAPEFRSHLSLPNGSISRWTSELEQAQELWLTLPGRYLWVVEVFELEPENEPGPVFWGYLRLEFALNRDQDDPSPPTFGASGSCYTPNSNHNLDYHLCLESVDGLVPQHLNSLNSLCLESWIRSPGACPRVSGLHQQPLHGYCTQADNKGQLYYYSKPGRVYLGSYAQNQCLNKGGQWHNF